MRIEVLALATWTTYIPDDGRKRLQRQATASTACMNGACGFHGLGIKFGREKGENGSSPHPTYSAYSTSAPQQVHLSASGNGAIYFCNVLLVATIIVTSLVFVLI
jgi:hypothetical protein